MGLRVLGSVIGDRDKPDAQTVSDGVAAALRNIQQVGKAGIGDKTLVDVLAPASDTLTAAVAGGQGLAAAFRSAAEVADKAAQATADLLPKVGPGPTTGREKPRDTRCRSGVDGPGVQRRQPRARKATNDSRI